MRLKIAFTGDEIRKWGSGVLVECWERNLGRQGSGSFKRKFDQEFNTEEQRELKSMLKKFREWELVWGYPQEAEFTMAQRDLVVRAANLFLENTR